MTASQYTRFRLQVRDPTRYFNQVLRLDKLTQQYMCDGFARQESGRMNYVRHHHKKSGLRSTAVPTTLYTMKRDVKLS
ncbi:Hypothetical protein FKW44_016326, partial [Caligus rogercresseyi]